ncbi:hypothetical protein BN873_350050 [Candidatus Competibacter denitrificans Run_A_D11]|uniref:Uncharacterized protein n=1 Tax=Candidatus Competibacter denitrificans Run_A_D11 TaxID=1400863 RepID=W6M822_9GAMM|nr:hypothetical protein BN873_350050 [Candidatus Competibacter denitrificans Run_A_D11]
MLLLPATEGAMSLRAGKVTPLSPCLSGQRSVVAGDGCDGVSVIQRRFSWRGARGDGSAKGASGILG